MVYQAFSFGPQISSQIMTQILIRFDQAPPSLGLFLDSSSNLNLPVSLYLLFAFGFFTFVPSVYLTFTASHIWLTVVAWLLDQGVSLLLSSLLFLFPLYNLDFSSYLFSLPTSPALPLLCLVIGLSSLY